MRVDGRMVRKLLTGRTSLAEPWAVNNFWITIHRLEIFHQHSIGSTGVQAWGPGPRSLLMVFGKQVISGPDPKEHRLNADESSESWVACRRLPDDRPVVIFFLAILWTVHQVIVSDSQTTAIMKMEIVSTRRWKKEIADGRDDLPEAAIFFHRRHYLFHFHWAVTFISSGSVECIVVGPVAWTPG